MSPVGTKRTSATMPKMSVPEAKADLTVGQYDFRNGPSRTTSLLLPQIRDDVWRKTKTLADEIGAWTLYCPGV
jgi:hypothetical protein